MTRLKWTCDAQGNWRQVLVAGRLVNGKWVEPGRALELGGPTAVWGRAA